MIDRSLLKKLQQQCFKGKTILLLGARQVGKTTLLKKLQDNLKVQSVWLNADEGDVLGAFEKATTSTQLLQIIGPASKLVIIDEAHQIPDIGRKLKLLYDTNPQIQVIATGSSSFDLLNHTNEALTGRKRTYYLYPVSYAETVRNTSVLEAKRMLDTRLVYGLYPDVINNRGKEREAISEIAHSYLYKDILKVDGLRKSSYMEKLLQALAFQVGNEVNYNELAKTIGNIDTATVEKYIDLLEKTFVIFKLPALSRNLRNELKKGKKYYFYDNGIRNYLINNFNQPELRFDKGAMWENFIISERVKANEYNGNAVNAYFWRTHDQAEIDYIEEKDGMLNAYEIKYKDTKARFPQSFLTAYPQHTTQTISMENFEEFIKVK